MSEICFRKSENFKEVMEFKRFPLRKSVTVCETAKISEVEGKKVFRRSDSFKTKPNLNFLQKAKLKIKQNEAKIAGMNFLGKYEGSSPASDSTNFRSFCGEIGKNCESYIIRPDGDWDELEEI